MLPPVALPHLFTTTTTLTISTNVTVTLATYYYHRHYRHRYYHTHTLSTLLLSHTIDELKKRYEKAANKINRRNGVVSTKAIDCSLKEHRARWKRMDQARLVSGLGVRLTGGFACLLHMHSQCLFFARRKKKRQKSPEQRKLKAG